MAPNASLAGVSPFPVLVKTDDVSSLQRLKLSATGEGVDGRWVANRGRVYVSAEVVIGEDHLLNTVGPYFGIFIVDGIRRYTSPCRCQILCYRKNGRNN